MAPLAQFKATYPFIVLFFLLLILYLSLNSIRKSLEPLEKLKKGTRRIATGDFSAPVSITSGDEFEDLGDAFNTMTSRLDQRFLALELLRDIEQSILSSVHRVETLTTTLYKLKNFFNSDISVFLKKTDTSGTLVKIYAMKGRRKEDPVIDYLDLSPENIDYLFNNNSNILLSEDESLLRVLSSQARGGALNNLLALPIVVDDKLDRVVILGWSEKKVLLEEKKDQARQIADQLAIALANANLIEKMKKLAMGTIETLARTVDAKSRWTSGHSERVAALSGKIAKALNCSEEAMQMLNRGALLHDIGKIGIPLSILDKPGKLTDEEFFEIKRHPEIGARILEPIEAFQPILPMIEQHHEKYDGTGYPHKLKGEAIDINARILAVADVWDAVVSNRPYRDGWVHDRARKLIVDGAGTHFDPRVVEAFLAIVNES